MAVEYLRQSNWTNGELDPQMIGRRDLKAYFASAAMLENHLTTPQGPLLRRPGTDYIGKVRRELEAVALTGATLAAPQGGDPGDLGGDGMTTVTELQSVDPYVVLTVDFGAATQVHLIDVKNYAAHLTGVTPSEAPFSYPWSQTQVQNALAWQYQVGGDWITFGASHSLSTFKQTRRFGIGPREGVSARYWRLIKIGDHDWDAALISVEDVLFWRETSELSAYRLWRFSFDTENQRYVLVATPGNVEVYHLDQRVASIAIPHIGIDLIKTTRAQQLDTMVVWHVDHAPLRITRQGQHGEWDSRAAAFLNVPKFDYTGEALDGVNDVQQLRFTDFVGGDTFNITLEGETTTSILYNASGATTAAAITAALEALPNVGADGVDVVSDGGGVFTVTFVGKNANSDVGEMAPVTISSTSGGITCATLTQGKAGGEPIFSATRGYPACGTFYQGRLWMAGLKSRPQTALGSTLTGYFDFDVAGAKSEAAIAIDLDTDEMTSIRGMFPGRHLQIFTSSAEFYFPTEPIVPVPAVKQTTRRGIEAGTPIAEMDGATLFVTYGGDACAEFLYDDNQQSYTAEHLSYLHSHLLEDVSDFAFRRARSTTRANLGLFVRRDGDAVCMISLRTQDVTGFSRWTTAGSFRAVTADIEGDLYAIVERADETGAPDFHLEKFTEDSYLDCAVRQTTEDAPIEQVYAPHLEGLEVTVYADDSYDGEVTVSGGYAVLTNPALRNVQIGLNFVPRGRTLPFVLQNDPRGGLGVGVRTGEINWRLGPTGNLNAGLVDGRLWAVPLKRRPGTPLDEGTGENAFEGLTRQFGIPGFRPEAQLEWAQLKPGPLCIQEIIAVVNS